MGKEIIYDKLVRDLVPNIIKAEGKRPFWHKADKEEFLKRFPEKIKEELQEFMESRSLVEFGDLLQAVLDYGDLSGISEESARMVMEVKAKERGTFKEGIVLDKVEEDA
jgi:predicted house-cleaning noncanonical NTP pyrophosphatase (MazG superfamily)